MSTNNKYWQLWRKGTLLYCLWKYKFVKPLWRFLKTLKMKLPYDPEIPLLGISKISEIRISKRYLHSHDHSSTIHKPIYSVSEKKKKKNPAI